MNRLRCHYCGYSTTTNTLSVPPSTIKCPICGHGLYYVGGDEDK